MRAITGLLLVLAAACKGGGDDTAASGSPPAIEGRYNVQVNWARGCEGDSSWVEDWANGALSVTGSDNDVTFDYYDGMAFSGSVGVDAPQQVIGVGFTTNLTRAAGSETWQRWSFNSHSVVSPDEGATIWDASIDLDGDDDPYHEPIDEVAPKGLDGEEYLWRLTYDSVSIVNSGHCYIY